MRRFHLVARDRRGYNLAVSSKSKTTILQRILFPASVLAGLFLHFANPAYNWLTIACLAGIALYFNRRNFALFGPSLFFLLVYLTGMFPFTNLGLFFIIPLALYLILILIFKPLREKTGWLKVGHFDRTTVILGVVVIIISSTALLVWTAGAKPQLNDILNMIPLQSPGTLLLIGLAFAVFNSIVEESIYRGILWDGLSELFRPLIVINLIQAVIFGIAHIQGFPRGAVGMVLAFVYGVLLGFVRRRSKGLLAPILIHMAADMTVFLILLGMLGKL